MPLLTLLRHSVQLGATSRYERLVRFIAGRAREDGDAVPWDAYATTGAEGRRISYVQTCEGFAELAAREEPEAMIRRIFGEGDGNALLENLGQGVLSASYQVATIREDLSNITPGAEPAPLSHVTQLRSATGKNAGLEEMIRHVVEAAAKVDSQRRYGVLQTAIGDLRTYAVIQRVDDPAQLDKQAAVPELLIEAHGEQEGRRIFSEGTACIDDVHTELAVHLPELSNRS